MLANSKDVKMPVVALVGRPNVGKSTLFNRLTRTKDALVDPTPGLTRDLRYGIVEWRGQRIRLVDTGGLDLSESKEPFVRLVHEQSLKAIEQADLLLVVMDGPQGLTVDDREICELLRPRPKPLLLAVNKVDSQAQAAHLHEFYELGEDRFFPLSAIHGQGTDDLLDEIAGVLKDLGLSGEGPPDEAEQAEGEAPEAMRVALIGRPNAGKSSLFNRLVGESRMLVTDIPGTTRDAIDTLIERPQGRNIRLTDTAGIRRRARVKDRVEKFSILKAIEAIRTCDIALVVLDASEGITDQDKRLIGYTAEYGKACITLFNKWDLVQSDRALTALRAEELQRAKRFVGYSPHLNISALSGKNANRILPLLDEVFEEFTTTVNTGKANQVLKRAMALRTPPIAKGHHLKLYYTTQTSSAPPTFLVFTNYPEYIPTSYLRFLNNQFREQLELPRIPIQIVFRRRERRK